MIAIILVFYSTRLASTWSNPQSYGTRLSNGLGAPILAATKAADGNLSVTLTVGKAAILVRAFDRSQEHVMSRAPLVLSAIGIFCASSYFALADERGAIANAAARDGSTT